MSRITLACSLFVSFVASTASAQSFARPPEEPAVAQLMQPAPVDRASVRAKLAELRATNLRNFHTYVDAGVYPSNVFKAGELNIWRDAQGHYCAAATIIRMSGETALVERVAAQNNRIALATVKQGPLMDWILTSGLTQDEIALIQRPFRPVARELLEEVLAEPSAGVVDAKLRAAETARLKALYATIETTLQRNANASLDAAVERLMKQPELARRIVEG